MSLTTIRRPALALGLAAATIALAPLAASAAAPAHRLQLTVGPIAPLALTGPTTVTVKVANRGSRPAAKVRLAVRAAAGVTVTPASQSLHGTIRVHKARTVRVRLTPTGAAAVGPVTFTLTGRGAKHVTRTVKLVEGPAGRYFWTTTLVVGTTTMDAYYFVDGRWAYRGVPEGGLPSCTAQTAVGDGDGCVPYTYDPASGALVVGGKSGKLEADGIDLDGDAFGEAILAPAGTRYDTNAQYINGFGICPYCSFVSVGLVLTPDGQFARSSAVSGTTYESSFAVLPPDQHGSYTVDARGRIRFTYADGHVVTETVATMLGRADTPDPTYGLLLDDSAYFGPSSDVGS